MKKVMSLLLCLLMLAALPISANAMRVQHNIMAMNSYRNYNNNVSALSRNLEKLSSGYRINRAGDDAAGLAISEKMRAQISTLDVVAEARNADNEKSVLSCIWALLDAEGEWHYMDKEDGQILDQDALEEVLEQAKMQIFSGLYGQNNTPQGMFSGVCTSNSVNGIGYEADAEGKLNAVYQIVVTTDLQIIVNDNPRVALANTQGVVTFYEAGTVNIGVLDEDGNAVDSFSIQVNEDGTLVTAPYANKLTLQLGDTGSFGMSFSEKKDTPPDVKTELRNLQPAAQVAEYARNNALMKAAPEMLNQANKVPQGVLQMLQ